MHFHQHSLTLETLFIYCKAVQATDSYRAVCCNCLQLYCLLSGKSTLHWTTFNFFLSGHEGVNRYIIIKICNKSYCCGVEEPDEEKTYPEKDEELNEVHEGAFWSCYSYAYFKSSFFIIPFYCNVNFTHLYIKARL